MTYRNSSGRITDKNKILTHKYARETCMCLEASQNVFNEAQFFFSAHPNKQNKLRNEKRDPTKSHLATHWKNHHPHIRFHFRHSCSRLLSQVGTSTLRPPSKTRKIKSQSRGNPASHQSELIWNVPTCNHSHIRDFSLPRPTCIRQTIAQRPDAP